MDGTMCTAESHSYHGEQLITAFPSQQYDRPSIHDRYAQVSIYELIIHVLSTLELLIN